jgi:predicted Zn-ribbon and HTH transcriptional regulator
MTVQKLKQKIIDQLSEQNDPIILESILNLLNTSPNDSFISLNESQKESVRISRSQIRNGEIHDHDDVINEMKKWLKDK